MRTFLQMQHHTGRQRAGGMTSGRSVRFAGFLAILAAAGCVERKFVIESNVPNAQVYIDDRSIGAAPAYAPFEYYGYYTIRVVHPGYETIVKRVHVTAPWYSYPPLDFLVEVIWPFHIRDTRRYHFDLFEATQTRSDDILNAADALRQRGLMLPPPDRPAALPNAPWPSPSPAEIRLSVHLCRPVLARRRSPVPVYRLEGYSPLCHLNPLPRCQRPESCRACSLDICPGDRPIMSPVLEQEHPSGCRCRPATGGSANRVSHFLDRCRAPDRSSPRHQTGCTMC